MTPTCTFIGTPVAYGTYSWINRTAGERYSARLQVLVVANVAFGTVEVNVHVPILVTVHTTA